MRKIIVGCSAVAILTAAVGYTGAQLYANARLHAMIEDVKRSLPPGFSLTYGDVGSILVSETVQIREVELTTPDGGIIRIEKIFLSDAQRVPDGGITAARIVVEGIEGTGIVGTLVIDRLDVTDVTLPARSFGDASPAPALGRARAGNVRIGSARLDAAESALGFRSAILTDLDGRRLNGLSVQGAEFEFATGQDPEGLGLSIDKVSFSGIEAGDDGLIGAKRVVADAVEVGGDPGTVVVDKLDITGASFPSLPPVARPGGAVLDLVSAKDVAIRGARVTGDEVAMEFRSAVLSGIAGRRLDTLSVQGAEIELSKGGRSRPVGINVDKVSFSGIVAGNDGQIGAEKIVAGAVEVGADPGRVFLDGFDITGASFPGRLGAAETAGHILDLMSARNVAVRGARLVGGEGEIGFRSAVLSGVAGRRFDSLSVQGAEIELSEGMRSAPLGISVERFSLAGVGQVAEGKLGVERIVADAVEVGGEGGTFLLDRLDVTRAAYPERALADYSLTDVLDLLSAKHIQVRGGRLSAREAAFGFRLAILTGLDDRRLEELSISGAELAVAEGRDPRMIEIKVDRLSLAGIEKAARGTIGAEKILADAVAIGEGDRTLVVDRLDVTQATFPGPSVGGTSFAEALGQLTAKTVWVRGARLTGDRTALGFQSLVVSGFGDRKMDGLSIVGAKISLVSPADPRAIGISVQNLSLSGIGESVDGIIGAEKIVADAVELGREDGTVVFDKLDITRAAFPRGPFADGSLADILDDISAENIWIRGARLAAETGALDFGEAVITDVRDERIGGLTLNDARLEIRDGRHPGVVEMASFKVGDIDLHRLRAMPTDPLRAIDRFRIVGMTAEFEQGWKFAVEDFLVLDINAAGAVVTGFDATLTGLSFAVADIRNEGIRAFLSGLGYRSVTVDGAVSPRYDPEVRVQRLDGLSLVLRDGGRVEGFLSLGGLGPEIFRLSSWPGTVFASLMNTTLRGVELRYTDASLIGRLVDASARPDAGDAASVRAAFQDRAVQAAGGPKTRFGRELSGALGAFFRKSGQLVIAVAPPEAVPLVVFVGQMIAEPGPAADRFGLTAAHR